MRLAILLPVLLSAAPLFAAGAAVVHNDSANVPADQAGRIALAAKDSDHGLASLSLAVWAESAAAATPQDIAALVGYTRRGSGFAGRCAILLACTNQREGLVRSLAGQRDGKALAALTLAAWALFERADDDHLAELRTGDGPPARRLGSASSADFGTGAVGKMKGNADKAQSLSKAGLTQILLDLLADKDTGIRSSAALAIAYAGFDDPALITALDQAAEDKGPLAAARLLLRARLGQPVDAAEARAAFEDQRNQPKIIASDDPSLSLDPLTTPGAAMVCEAIGIAKDVKLLAILHEALEHKDIRVRQDAARAIRKLADPSSVPFLLASLKKPKRGDWPVLVQVCAALADIPLATSVEPLIEALATQEKPPTRLRQDLLYALSSIAGNQFGRTNAEAWNTWWEGQKEGFAVDVAASNAFRAKYRVQDMSVDQLGSFYGLAIASDRLSFVLDYSNSMNGDPIANLRANATETITNLARYVKFTLVAFNTGVICLDDYELSEDRKAALAFIANTAQSGQTRSYDGTETSFAFAEVDTVILLTDGQPTGGLITKWAAIQPLTNLLLRYRPIAIHTIDFRVGAKAGAAGKAKLDPLEQYANEHAGRYLIVE